MKNIIIIILLLTSIHCKSQNNDSAKGLLFALVNSEMTSGSGNKSIVKLEKVDPFNYVGDCYDSFYGISVDNYFTALGLGLLNSETIRTKLSKKSCSDLSFSGGVTNKTEEGFQMNSYSCGFVPKSCSSSAISAAGY